MIRPSTRALRARLRMTVALALVGCGGAGTFPAGSVVNSPGGGGTPQPPPNLVDVKVTIAVPAGKRHTFRPGYVSPNTQSVVIQLYSVNGQTVGGVNPKTINTDARAKNCKPGNGDTICTGTALGSPGDDVFSVTTYANPNATGAVLSVGTVEAKIHGNAGGVQIDRLSLTLYGVIASLQLSLTPKSGKRGHPVTSQVTLSAYDATGAQIVGPSDYDQPVVLAIQGDTAHAFHLQNGKQSGSSLTIRKPSSGITLKYDGSKKASPVSVAANLDGYGSVGASANFKLHGKQPPPPVGTIYVLNLGSNGGQSATVTEYDGKASGNAAPQRTLRLDSKLYARSIAVDSAGNLYVGYIDNTLGYDPGNGKPDAANEIAIYAPNASGSDHPTALITSTANSTVFPLYLNVDPSGRLVTYGATNVDGNAGDSVLTYAAGASGSVDPQYAFDFASPSIYYAGPSGLAIDSNNNFYVNGCLHSILGSSCGLNVAAEQDIGNPKASPARTVPWDSTTQLSAGFTSNVSLDSSGEIFIGVWAAQGSGSSKICQAAVNVYGAGASGGITDTPPLRVMSLGTMATQGNGCYSSRNPLLPYFPTIQLYGTSLFAVDDFNNAVVAFSAGGKGNVKPALRIAGSATQLNAPISLVVSSISGSAKAGPAKL